MFSSFQTRVTLADTDSAGVIFTGAPTGWAQLGFENLMRAMGLPVEVMLERDLHYPVVSFLIEHHAPLTLGVPLTIRTAVSYVGKRSVRIKSIIINENTQEKACTVTRTIVAKSRSGEQVEAEAFFRENLTQNLDEISVKKTPVG